jgi:hypothetical protein
MKTYLPGVNLIEEGSSPSGAFLILDGECRVYSEVDPAEVKIK